MKILFDSYQDKVKDADKPFHIKRVADNWVLAEIASHLEKNAKFSSSEQARPTARLNYFINYAQFETTDSASAAWFTHRDTNNPRLTKLWWDVLSEVDLAVFQSKKYEIEALARLPKLNSVVISPGIDSTKFKPRRTRIGVVGRSYRDGRKGEDLLAAVVARFPQIEWQVTGSRWPVSSTRVKPKDMPQFYRSLDFLLIPSRIEGGPMPAIEALASGVPVISSDVGWMPELPHIEFENGNLESLCEVIAEIERERTTLRNSVLNRSHHAFVSAHLASFTELVAN